MTRYSLHVKVTKKISWLNAKAKICIAIYFVKKKKKKIDEIFTISCIFSNSLHNFFSSYSNRLIFYRFSLSLILFQLKTFTFCLLLCFFFYLVCTLLFFSLTHSLFSRISFWIQLFYLVTTHIRMYSSFFLRKLQNFISLHIQFNFKNNLSL